MGRKRGSSSSADAADPAPKQSRGGGGRGQGRKRVHGLGSGDERHDTSICERGFSTMNNLKTARRSRMGTLLLRTLMTICELGKDWLDPAKIPVDDIVEVWRDGSSRGRYESAMWQAAALEEPTYAELTSNPGGSSSADAEDSDYDRLQQYGREDYGPRPSVIRGA